MVSTGPDREQTILRRHPFTTGPTTPCTPDQGTPRWYRDVKQAARQSWDQYNMLVERLALTVHESGIEFDQIICIARGGMRVGDVLSRDLRSAARHSLDALVLGRGRHGRAASSTSPST